MLKIWELERRLGFKWANGLSQNNLETDQIPILKALLEDIKRLKKEFAKVKPKTLRNSHDFFGRQQDLLISYASKLWPLPPEDTSGWLVDAQVNDWDGLYPKTLSYLNREDQNKLSKYFFYLLLENCVQHRAVENEPSTVNDASLPHDLENILVTIPVAHMLPSTAGTSMSRSCNSAHVQPGGGRIAQQAPEDSINTTLASDRAAEDNEEGWPSMSGHRNSMRSNSSSFQNVGLHGKGYLSLDQKRARSVGPDGEISYERDSSPAKRQKIHHPRRMRSRVVVLKLTAEKLRALVSALAPASAVCQKLLEEDTDDHMTKHDPDAGIRFDHDYPRRPRVAENTSFNGTVSCSPSALLASVASNQDMALSHSSAADSPPKQLREVDNEFDTEPSEIHLLADRETQQHVKQRSTSTSTPTENPLAGEVDDSSLIAGPSRITSLTLHPHSPLSTSDKGLSNLGISVTKHAASGVQDLGSSQTKTVLGEDIRERHSMTPSAIEPQTNVERKHEACDKSRTKAMTQLTESTSSDDAGIQTAQTPPRSTTIQGAVLSLELRLQDSNFQQFISVNLGTSLNEFFSSIQKRMTRRLSGKDIECLKLQLSSQGGQANPYMIEKDDVDTWENVCDNARATVIEGKKLKGIVEVEVN